MARTSDEEGDRPSAGERPRVLYIMGAGRSGSTILGVALGNCESVFFAGELDRWLPRAGVPRREGEELHRLWEEVLERADIPPELLGARTGALERSSELFDVRKWPRRRRLRAPYRDASAGLYRALSATTGGALLVDSSHYPLRARELRALDGIDLHLLYLMRDPQGVVASMDRRDVPERRFGLLRANAYLWLTSLLSVLVFMRHPRDRRVFVRYEDFVADPQRVLEAILRGTGRAVAVPDRTELSTGLPFHGNRLIESPSATLQRGGRSAPPRSWPTLALQLPWRVVAGRLRPAATP